MKHAGDNLKTILDAMVDLLEQNLMAVKGGLQFALILLLLDRHAEDIRSALQKCDVMLAELAFGSAVDFEHTEWRAITLQNDIHRTANTVLHEQFGSTKSLLIFEMIGNYGLASAQGIAAGEAKSAPTVACPTTPSPQPTPARTRSRFSAGMYSITLQYSASRPSAVTLAV